ncbi:response regulator transcription factor [Raineyella fluvialis]|uniref:Response regulator n=1 Tax=Raineyella fluvialis TaxID=2662261 RepID=A0A5Q2FFD1_9ACTN|nr:response regulator transcription factor [Raineyella fluvialis]QGF24497.1 response regulator [Raineyella fluvialis]
MRARVLVVDDEAAIRDVLRGYLEASAYDVIEAADAATALDLVRRDEPDVVLLDLGLPDRDGLEVMREFSGSTDAYVLVVSARAEEMDRLVGLRLGADDYITKPFSPREVVARVEAVLRRGRRPVAEDQREDDRREFEGLVVDRGRREVLVDAAPVELTALDFDLLAALGDAPGRVFSRRQLLERVWGGDFFGDERIVDVHVRTIRAALGDDPAAPRFVATVRGVGYKCVARPR